MQNIKHPEPTSMFFTGHSTFRYFKNLHCFNFCISMTKSIKQNISESKLQSLKIAQMSYFYGYSVRNSDSLKKLCFLALLFKKKTYLKTQSKTDASKSFVESNLLFRFTDSYICQPN